MWTKQVTPAPPLSNSDAGLCTMERLSHPQFSVLERFLSQDCKVRTIPSAWNGPGTSSDGACPLKAGAKLPCWALWTPNNKSGFKGASNAARFHGCEPDTPAESAAATPPTNTPHTPTPPTSSATLSDVAAVEGGQPPPNRYCHTIFPPEWRAKDWYVEGWAEGLLPDVHPWTVYVASFVLMWSVLFLPCGFLQFSFWGVLQCTAVCSTLVMFWAVLASTLPPGPMRDSEETPRECLVSY